MSSETEVSGGGEESSVSNTDTFVGQVKWFSNNLNYGFITVITKGEYNGKDVFVHQTNICPQVSNYRTLTAGEYVSFILTHNDNENHPIQGTNVTGYDGGKLMCDFYQQRNNKDSDSNKNHHHNNNRSYNNGGGGKGGGRQQHTNQ